MKKMKTKKLRPIPVRLDPQPGWNLGRHVHVTIADGAPVPHFLQAMIVKTKQGGQK